MKITRVVGTSSATRPGDPACLLVGHQAKAQAAAAQLMDPVILVGTSTRAVKTAANKNKIQRSNVRMREAAQSLRKAVGVCSRGSYTACELVYYCLKVDDDNSRCMTKLLF